VGALPPLSGARARARALNSASSSASIIISSSAMAHSLGARVGLLLLLALSVPCVGGFVAVPLGRRRAVCARSAAPQMVDPSALVATVAPALAAPGLAPIIDPWVDPHNLGNLIPDIIDTTLVAFLGLSGAYLTQGAEGASPPPERPRRPRRRAGDRTLPPPRDDMNDYDRDPYGYDDDDDELYPWNAPR
tara:strand:- start:1788 stop:2357 length:570 start_codon:yes stop_codon:yes gene_type:complete